MACGRSGNIEGLEQLLAQTVPASDLRLIRLNPSSPNQVSEQSFPADSDLLKEAW